MRTPGIPRVASMNSGHVLLAGCLLACVLTAPVQAAFHVMQIEQVIGGVNGDTTAQAIQLRMRSVGQTVMSASRLKAFGANGSIATMVLLVDMTTNVANGAPGSRVLIATPNFANYTSPPVVPDFTMTPIPASYLA